MGQRQVLDSLVVALRLRKHDESQQRLNELRNHVPLLFGHVSFLDEVL
jgi:hypothetical protein